MANFFNIFAGFLTFFVSAIIIYGLWTPVMQLLFFFPIQLYVMAGLMWILMCFAGMCLMPMIMFVSDDRGR